ncbi:MAG: THUMP domain-containing protein [Chitinophagales bacterium]|jgi:putative N6-adenine-specific DNA methylase|nr:THUMP domain-containing protein [Chitinophagales bacterium]
MHPKYIAKTFFNLEPYLEKELISLGAQNTYIINRSVTFNADRATMMKINMSSRLSIRIYEVLFDFEIKDIDQMYQAIFQYPWTNLFGLNHTFKIESVVNSEDYPNSLFIAQKSKDAIVDRFYKEYDKRPNIDTKFPDIRIQVYISKKNTCTISLDTSGAPLFKRGYRTKSSPAAINEVLASGIIDISKWNGEPFYDLMCGSGTFFLEAMMKQMNFPVNASRIQWPFFLRKDFDETQYRAVRDELQSNVKSIDTEFLVQDKSLQAMDMAKTNYFNTKLKVSSLWFNHQDFFEFEPANHPKGFLFLNPPYNERLKLEDEITWYIDLGNTLKQNFKGFDVWLISSNKSGLKQIGLKPNAKISLRNGDLVSELCHYKIF